jgi:hypothetical protein
MTKEKKDSALVFVGQIMTAYKAAMRVEGEALKAAMECGKYLNLAKENVKADKGKWLPWLKQNCPEISQQTASLYMRLADPDNLDKLVGVKTIRDADKALRQSSQHEDSEEDDDAEETNNALLKSGSPDLKALMENCGADEIGIALRDADKLEEVATHSITKLSPDKVYDALTKAWPADQLRDLIKRLSAFVESLAATPPPPTAPSVTRRMVVS